MSDPWYKDPKSGKLYQERRERGKIVRRYRDDPQDSSRSREEPSSSRRDYPPSRTRRDLVISRGSEDPRPLSKHLTQRGTSSKRETSGRPDDSGRRIERSEDTAYTSFDRGQDDLRHTYGERQAQGLYRDSEKQHPQDGGYNAPLSYTATTATDPADTLGQGLQRLSISTDYPNQTVTSSPPTRSAHVDTAGFKALDPATTDFAPASSTQTPNPPRRPDSRREVRGTPHLGNREKLDESYRIRKRDYKEFFRVGRVFATLWTEGVGHYIDDKDKTFVSDVIYKERVHSKIRRFVVLREGDRSVSCLPVTSYGGCGPRKRDIRLGEHGFIYSKDVPEKVEGMLSRPLKVILSKGVQVKDLTDPSLVNYGKVYTVETNVKVKDVGDLHADAKAILRHYFKKVFYGGDSDMPSEIEDTPKQSNAILAHVGGVASALPSTSQFNAPISAAGYPPTPMYFTSTDTPRGDPSTTYAIGYGTGYAPAQDTQPARYGSTYPLYGAGNWQNPTGIQAPRADYASQPTPTYSVATATGYTSASVYGTAAAGAAEYNTTPSYYPPPATPYLPDSYPASTTSQYGAGAVPRKVDPYLYATSGDTYVQPSGSQAASGSGTHGGGSGGGYGGASSTGHSDYGPISAEREEDISLTTVEEEKDRRRHESITGTARERHRKGRR